MRLTGNILLHSLQESFAIDEVQGIGQCRALEGLLLLGAHSRIMPGWVYIVDTGLPLSVDLLEDDNVLFLLVGGGEFPFRQRGGWIRIRGQVRVEDVLNLVSLTFSRYEKWIEELEKIQYRFGSVEEMLRASLPVFENPLMVIDPEMVVTDLVTGDSSLQESADFFADGPERMEIINAILQDPEYARNHIRTESYWGPAHHMGFRSIWWNIIQGDETQYCLSVIEENRPLTQADMDLLEMLGFHVKFVLSHQERRSAGRYENLSRMMERILSDRTLDHLDASRQLSELGWGSRHRYFCLVFQLTYLDRSVLPISSICRYMEQMYECCSFLHGEDIVTFFDLTRSEMSLEEIQNQLKPFIRDSYLKAGFSRCADGHMHLRHQYVQACIALDVGSRHAPYQWIHYFDQLAYVYLQEQMTRRLPGELLVHEGILRLRDHDREQGTEYRKTLRVYLDNQMNAVHSARQLFIHRSTFLYRLDKICKLLDCDLTDPDEVQYIALSLRLLELGE